MGFESTCDFLASNGCTIISTEEEYRVQKKHKKIKFVAQCGHANEVFWTNLKKGSGLICKPCMDKKRGILKLDEMKDDKHMYARRGFEGMQSVLQRLTSHFDHVVTGECCLADAVIRPKGVSDDKWLRIQFKTTYQPLHGLYSFKIRNTYTDCIVLCYCTSDDRIWMFLGNQLTKKTLNIGLTDKSIFSKYEVKWDNVNVQLLEFYRSVKLTTCEDADTPITENSRLEKENRTKREVCYALPYKYSDFPVHHDFILNGYKVQEKTLSVRHDKTTNGFNVALHRNTRLGFKPYDKGMNDFYWLHLPNNDGFYIIPEHVLEYHKYIMVEGKQDGRRSLFINRNPGDRWYNDYEYSYKTTPIEKIKEIFNI